MPSSTVDTVFAATADARANGIAWVLFRHREADSVPFGPDRSSPLRGTAVGSQRVQHRAPELGLQEP